MVTDISINDYSYVLPDEYIAKYPLADRASSRLLIARPTSNAYQLTERRFINISEELPQSAVLVRNNSKVIHARLMFQRTTGAVVEVFCLEPLEPSSYELSLQSQGSCTWHCMLGNAKRWKTGGEVLSRSLAHPDLGEVTLSAQRLTHDSVRFSWNNDVYTFGAILEAMGILPIPPYLNRETEEQDDNTYQTVYAEHEGSVAAPTAGLHFTSEVFEDLSSRGVQVLDVTLHVGAGTFLPVKSETIGEHEMHRELISVSRDMVQSLYKALGNIVAVGTTSVRTLESLYHLGVQLYQDKDLEPTSLSVRQWEAYEHQAELNEVSAEQSLSAILAYMNDKGLDKLVFPTAILIAPGYRFRIVEALITNFHQPNSTLLLLIAAFVGEEWRKVYAYALQESFRFLSYGDSSLLFRNNIKH